MWLRVTAKFLLTRSVLTIGLAAVTALLAVHQQAPAPISHRPAVHAPVTAPSTAGRTSTVSGTAVVTPQAPETGAAAAVGYALAQLGVPYRWGGSGTDGFDCSGLVMRAWAAGGVRLPHNAAAQAAAGTRITRDQLRPGDLVLSNGFGHVQLYIGDGRVVEAPHTGAVVRITALPLSGQVDAYVHVAA